MQRIPISAIPSQTFNVVLEDQHCTISLYWKQERLYFDLGVGAVPVCQGAICQNRADILQSRSLDFSGSLHFWDLEGDSPPYWQQLNSRFLLLYIPAGESLPEELRF